MVNKNEEKSLLQKVEEKNTGNGEHYNNKSNAWFKRSGKKQDGDRVKEGERGRLRVREDVFWVCHETELFRFLVVIV